jgi:RNA polymerase sigma-70 factor (ECF subfamily)
MAMTRERPAVDSVEFAEHFEPYRRELLAHCYRMVGSLDDAEDLVQETYIRAWRAYGTFEGRSSVRTWLYRIATNVCLSALQHRARRVLPSGLGPASAYPPLPSTTDSSEIAWLQPIPEAIAGPPSDDPEIVAESRASLRLALIAALQYLPPRQRAALILCEVLDWPAANAAEALSTTSAALKSMLQRARARIRDVSPTWEDMIEPTAPEAKSLLETYIAAFESSDVQMLARVLKAEAAIEVIPSRTWFSGISVCVPFLAAEAMFSPGDWRLLPTTANGQPSAAAYLRDAKGTYRAYGLALLTCKSGGIARITAFVGAELVVKAGFADALPTGVG